jgi:mitochondrial fission protein ELM1
MAADLIVWILSGGRKGDLDQMLALAGALGWPHEVKTLRFRGPSHPLFAAQRIDNAPTAPWPDLVLCAEAMTSVAARMIKRKSGGRTRIVCLGRPAGATRHFDAVLTAAHYRLPAASNVLELLMPLTTSPAPQASPPGDGPIAVSVGGPAFPDLLDADVAQDLARRLVAHAAARSRPLDVHTSPRTPEDAVEALRRTITPPHRLSVFGETEDRYRTSLAKASEIVVTSDSVSMLADALHAARPVAVYRLPQDRGLKLQLGNWFYRNAVLDQRAFLGPVRWLFESGMIEPAADRWALIDRLAAEGRLSWYGAEPAPPRRDLANTDLDAATALVRRLMQR